MAQSLNSRIGLAETEGCSILGQPGPQDKTLCPPLLDRKQRPSRGAYTEIETIEGQCPDYRPQLYFCLRMARISSLTGFRITMETHLGGCIFRGISKELHQSKKSHHERRQHYPLGWGPELSEKEETEPRPWACSVPVFPLWTQCDHLAPMPAALPS